MQTTKRKIDMLISLHVGIIVVVFITRNEVAIAYCFYCRFLLVMLIVDKVFLSSIHLIFSIFSIVDRSV